MSVPAPVVDRSPAFLCPVAPSTHEEHNDFDFGLHPRPPIFMVAFSLAGES
jgi:hypothetical protein